MKDIREFEIILVKIKKRIYKKHKHITQYSFFKMNSENKNEDLSTC